MLGRFLRGRWAMVVAVVACVAVAAGIGVLVAAGTGGGGSGSSGRPDLTLGVEQYRDDEPDHALQIAVHNHEPVRVTVLSVQFVSPDFEPTGPVAYEEQLPLRGLKIDFRTPFGNGRCDGLTVPDQAGPATAVLRVRTADGTVGDYTYPLPDPEKLLDRLLTAECRLALVANVAEISFGHTWTVVRRGGQPVLHGSIEIRRTNLDRRLDVTNVLGSVLFAFGLPGRAPLATLAPGQTVASFPLEVTTPRCTGHAFGESKQTFYFRVWVRIDNGEEMGVTFVPDDRAKGAMHQLQTLCPPEE